MNAALTILTGDCRDTLATLPEHSVQCCVTSPPYFGLRDYGTATWSGGKPECDHRNANAHQKQGATSQRKGRANVEAQRNENFRGECPNCGATRTDQQIGMEKTPEEFVASLVSVFRAVARVLREDGTLWLNLGDSYTSGGRTTRDPGQSDRHVAQPKGMSRVATPPGLKPKDLIGIPWRVALALQADGWYLRSDIIWHKPNPMPESVTDRPSNAHEHIFLLSKREFYFYDHEAIKEPASDAMMLEVEEGYDGLGIKDYKAAGVQNPSEVKTRIIANARKTDGKIMVNKKNVWTVNTAPYPEAHFATFPPALIKPCILAGTKPGDLVLDPFGGSGTTGMVALELGRRALLLELNPVYAALARDRCHVTPGLPL